MSDARDSDEIADYPEPDKHGIIRQPHLPYELSTADSPGAADFIERSKRLADEGFFDIDTHRTRSSASQRYADADHAPIDDARSRAMRR